MRVSIIVDDASVTVDGFTVRNLDLSFIPSTVHAVQWYGTKGEVEHKDEDGRMIANKPITDFSDFQPAVEAWQTKKDAEEAENAAKLAAYKLSKQTQ